MPAKVNLPDKKCSNCYILFNRWIKNGKLEPTSDFKIRKFCSHDCYVKYNIGANHYNFNPNGNSREDGYVRIAVNGKRVYLHRYVMEQNIGRKLEKHEHVHHKDGNPLNNNINNLELTTNSLHLKMHYKERNINKKGQFVSNE